MLRPLPFLTLSAFIASALASQARTVRPDVPPTSAPGYRRDTLVMRLETAYGRLDVIGERNPSDPGTLSGRYYLRLNRTVIAAVEEPSIMRGAPGLAGYYAGDPTVIVLGTYTGGTGASAVPGYFLKVVCLRLDARGSVRVEAYSLGGNEEVTTDHFRAVRGPADGQFTLASEEYTLSYIGGKLQVSARGGASEAAPAPTPAEERAYVAAMKSDLRNLVTAEEAFFADSVRYTSKIGDLTYTVTQGNLLPRITLTTDGWGAVIGNARTRTTCVIFIGATPQPPAVKEGVPACR